MGEGEGVVWCGKGIVFHLLLLQTLDAGALRLDGKLLLLSTLQPSGQMMKKPLHTFVRCPEMQRTTPSSAAGNGNEGMKTIMLLLLLQVASGSIADAKAVAAAAGAGNQLKL